MAYIILIDHHVCVSSLQFSKVFIRTVLFCAILQLAVSYLSVCVFLCSIVSFFHYIIASTFVVNKRIYVKDHFDIVQ